MSNLLLSRKRQTSSCRSFSSALATSALTTSSFDKLCRDRNHSSALLPTFLRRFPSGFLDYSFVSPSFFVSTPRPSRRMSSLVTDVPYVLMQVERSLKIAKIFVDLRKSLGLFGTPTLESSGHTEIEINRQIAPHISGKRSLNLPLQFEFSLLHLYLPPITSVRVCSRPDTICRAV